MIGSIKGFASLVKQENPDVILTYCFLHREMLISKSLGDELKKVFDDVTKMVKLLIKNQFTSECLKDCVRTWIKNT